MQELTAHVQFQRIISEGRNSHIEDFYDGVSARCRGLVDHQRAGNDWRSRTVSRFDRNLAINRVFSIGHVQRWLPCLEVESRAQQKGDVEIKFGV
jgi:hypothetical protein